jgi:hypothetical protein
MQGLVKLPGERSTISAMLIGMNFRALSFSSFHGARGEPPVRGFLPRPCGWKPAHGHYVGVGHRSQHRLGCCRSRDSGGQEKADEDH